MLKSMKFWRAFGVVTCITVCHQLSGALPVIFNALTLIDFTGSGQLTSTQLSLICVAIQMIACMLGILMVKFIGRRILLTVSSTLMGLFLIFLGWFIMERENNSQLHSTYYWVPPTLIVLFFGSYSIGLGPITSSLLADSFPIELRITTVSFVVAIGWFFCLLLNSRLNVILMNLGLPITLYTFAGFCWLSAIVAGFFISDTRGKHLVDIQGEFLIS